jgi:hypothetical protein
MEDNKQTYGQTQIHKQTARCYHKPAFVFQNKGYKLRRDVLHEIVHGFADAI